MVLHDLLTAMEEGLESRRVGDAVRLEVDSDMPKRLVDMLASRLELSLHLIYRSIIPLSMVDLWQLHGLRRPDLQDAPFLPCIPKQVSNEQTILANVADHDVLLYHPYDSFQPLITFLKQAAIDPEVMVDALPRYPVKRESHKFEARRRAEVEERLKEEAQGLDCDRLLTLDGYRAEFPDGWFLVRLSGTEPKVRVTVEARDEKELERLTELSSRVVGRCLQ